MQIIEVKNNLVKVSYVSEENLVLSSFVIIKDVSQSFIAQVMHLEATEKGNFAIAKLLFNFNDAGLVTNYNGTIPSVESPVGAIYAHELLELLNVQKPVVIGELAQQNLILNLDRVLLENKLLVCCEKTADKKQLAKNLSSQLSHHRKKMVIIDLVGDVDFSMNRVVATEDFKLPLNYETINFIYEKGLDDANAETKALIQDIFLEVQDYVKSLDEKFIPFDTFKDVVDSQYQELEIVELVLLKNKLLKYQEAGIFANSADDFISVKASLAHNQTSVIDLSNLDEKFQREAISYIYKVIGEFQNDFYVFANISNENSDKKLLKQIFNTKNAYSTVVCDYSYKYLNELKQLAKDLILFAPIKQQSDFAGYNTFLNKLNNDEFIIYGNSTHHLPLIVKLDENPQKIFEKIEHDENTASQVEEIHSFEEEIEPQEDLQRENFEESVIEEEIKKDVDTIYSAPKNEGYDSGNSPATVISTEDLTDEDLDFLDDLNIAQEPIPDEPLIVEQEIEVEEQVFFDEPSINVGEVEEEPFLQEQVFEEPASQSFQGAMNELREEPEQVIDILPASESSTPIVPIYSAHIEGREDVDKESFVQGDLVVHAKYGKGVIEKMISYGTKTLCSINFDNVGRRLLDPTLAELKKV